MIRFPETALRAPVVLLALLLASAAAAQAPDLTWAPLPGPYGGTAEGVASLPGGLVAVATHAGSLYRTENGGQAWARVPLDRPNLGRVVAVPDGDFWALGDPLLRSQDGGRTWADLSTGLPQGNADALAETPDGTRVAVSAGGVYRLAAGAQAWAPTGFTGVQAPLVASPTGTLLVAGDGRGNGSFLSVSRSADGGQSWTTTTLDPAYAVVEALVFLPDGTALAGGRSLPKGYARPGLFRSNDDGLTWAPDPSLPETEIVGLFAAGGVVTATTYDLGPLRSADGGQTWTPTEEFVTGLADGPDGSVLAATVDFGILRSDNRAETFTDASDGFGRAAASHVVVGDDGLVVAAQSSDASVGTGVYRSADGGQTWARIALGFAPRGLSDLHRDAAGRLFAAPATCTGVPACAPMAVYRSLDGGLTWAPTPLARPVPFAQARVFDGVGGALWALFNTRALYRSADGGDSWEPVAPAPFAMTFTVGADGTLWAGSGQSNGVSVARSADGGASWTTVLADAPGLRTGALVVAGDGSVVVGASGRGYRSSDNGATWPGVDFGFAQTWYELDVLRLSPDGSLFAGADAGTPVLRSRDDGQTWAPVAAGLPETRYSVDLALGQDGVLWAALGTRGLYRTTASTFVADEPAVGNATLGLAVAPNPSRGAAAVTLTLGRAAHATVAIFDALGRRIALLHDGPTAGTLALRLTEALPPGVYAVRATAGREVATRRLVVVR